MCSKVEAWRRSVWIARSIWAVRPLSPGRPWDTTVWKPKCCLIKGTFWHKLSIVGSESATSSSLSTWFIIKENRVRCSAWPLKFEPFVSTGIAVSILVWQSKPTSTVMAGSSGVILHSSSQFASLGLHVVLQELHQQVAVHPSCSCRIHRSHTKTCVWVQKKPFLFWRGSRLSLRFDALVLKLLSVELVGILEKTLMFKLLDWFVKTSLWNLTWKCPSTQRQLSSALCFCPC